MANETKMNNGTAEAPSQNVTTQQNQEQVEVLKADADAADTRSLQAREAFQTVCQQAAQALNLAPTAPQGQILVQALMAAFQWGGEAANASDHATQRRKEVALLLQIAKTNEDELKESRQRRAKEAEESLQRTKILERLASSHEKGITVNEKLLTKLDSLLPVVGAVAKEKASEAGA